MKKVSCNIIRDMLPLYVDDLVSDDTRAMVEEHFGSCEECCKEVFLLKKDLVLPANPDLLFEEAKMLLKLKRRMQLKKILTVVVSVLTAVGILAGIYYWANTKKICVPYEDLQLEFVNNNGYMWFRGTEEYSKMVTTEVFDRRVEKMGTVYTYKTMVVCVYDTVWSRYIEPIFWWNKEEEKVKYLGTSSELDLIYYGEPDSYVFDDMELIWSDVKW